jgi:hypothetical protein
MTYRVWVTDFSGTKPRICTENCPLLLSSSSLACHFNSFYLKVKLRFLALSFRIKTKFKQLES